MLPIHVARRAAKRPRLLRFRQLRDGLRDDAVPVGLQTLGRRDGVGKGDGAAQAAGRSVAGRPVLRVLQGAPAADDLGGVGQVDLAVRRRQMSLQGGVHVLLRHGEHHDLVIGQQVLLHRPRERQAMKLRSVGRLVVHGEHVDAVAGCLGLGAVRVQPRRGGHVEAPGGADSLRVVDQHERRGLVAGALDAGCPVRLVAQDQVEGRGAVVLGLPHQVE